MLKGIHRILAGGMALLGFSACKGSEEPVDRSTSGTPGKPLTEKDRYDNAEPLAGHNKHLSKTPDKVMVNG
jgi:hypothetical protein